MTYFQSPELLIRDMTDTDVAARVADDTAHGWETSDERHRERLIDAAAGRSIALTADYQGQPAGFLSIYFPARIYVYAERGIPELVDFGVFDKFWRHGIGSALMDIAEGIVGERTDRVCLGVGLHSGYGAAQSLYVRRGYIPDGTGVWYQDKVCEPYGECRNDDDLILYMVKELG